MIPSTEAFNSRIFKEPLEFNFYSYTTNNLLQIADRTGFINIHEVNRFLGRRYCLPKQQIKRLLVTLRSMGYVEIEKRGIRLL